MKIFRRVLGGAVLWLAALTMPLAAEVLVRLSDEEMAYQIKEIDGEILLGMESGLYRMEGNEAISVLTGMPVTAISESSGKVWFGTGCRGLYYVEGSLPIRELHEGSLQKLRKGISEDACVIRIREVEDNKTWVGTKSGLYKITWDEVTKFEFENLGQVHTIENIDGELWAGTSRNAYRFDKLGKPSQFFQDDREIIKITQAGGHLWMIPSVRRGATQYGPCLRVESDSVTPHPDAEAECLSVAEKDGNLWFSTTQGLFKEFAGVSERVGFGDENINTIAFIGKNIWVGTAKAAYVIRREGSSVIQQEGAKIISPRFGPLMGILEILEINEKVWLRTWTGVYRFDEDVVLEVQPATVPFTNLLFSRFNLVEVRYSRDRKDPYGDSVESDFQVILELEEDKFNDALEEGDFVPIDRFGPRLATGRHRIYLAARDAYGNEVQVGPYQIFALDPIFLLVAVVIAAVIWQLKSRRTVPTRRRVSVPEADSEDEGQRRADDKENSATTPLEVRDESDIIDKRFKVLEELGQGGMGRVYLAQDLHLKRHVALKRLYGHFNEENVESFIKEAQLLASLDHPNIVRIYDSFDACGGYYIVMEYVDGKPLGQLLRADLAYCRTHLKSIFLQICRGLDSAHARGVVHRDLKPNNVMVTLQGKQLPAVKIVDFGTAKFLEDPRRTSSLEGTLPYMAPERLRGELGPHVDIFSLGRMLYEVATGSLPQFEEPVQYISQEAPLPSQVNPSISPDFERLILSSVALDKDARIQSVGEVVAALERIEPLFLPS